MKMRVIYLLVVIAIIGLISSPVEAKRKKITNDAPAQDNAYESMRPKAVAPKATTLSPANITVLSKSPVARKARAKELHALGIEKAMAGNYNEGLPHMRAAVRMDPTNTGYLNDLGVTEMRVGQHQKAKLRFLKAKEIDPTYTTIDDNIAEIKKYLTEKEYQLGLGKYPQKHKLQEPPEMDPYEFLSLKVKDDAENPLLMGDAPLCIRGAAQAWGWDFEKITLDHLAENYGTSNADYYPHNMKEETVHPIFNTLKSSIEQLSLPLEGYMNLDTSNPGTYIQWNVDENSWRNLMNDMGGTMPEIFEDKHWTEKCLDNDGVTTFNKNLHWKMMLIGEKDAGMFNHKDVMRMASWQVQLAGRKLWHICHPDEDLYKAGAVNTFHPDYENFPRVLNASCYQTITNPGDAMYYPRDWWHQTRNLETPSIAFSGSMVNKNCHREFSLKLLDQCNGRGNVFHASPEHCKALETCIKNWDISYEQGEGKLPLDFVADNKDFQAGPRPDPNESKNPAASTTAVSIDENEDIDFHDEM
jgi:tetratricopeptide (TPR) repeat protein